MRTSPTVISLAALVIATAALIVPPGTRLGERLVGCLTALAQLPWIPAATWAALGVLALAGIVLSALDRSTRPGTVRPRRPRKRPKRRTPPR
ncbi:hypothetical protein CU254_41640 (plasmid) [Amycolatopsis sp. AA4]|uniref:hypothetical protein n=1 Tax=Actinomycetes TaxID=1760 RepID=UPI0001B5517F|nr:MULTISPECIES: hypothetical protein [Actinomycetes]ATY17084.1 hypothetical protein CU254_41640 [Amycolatopsis sp. AA4]EFL12412.1 predicted protein [Streptomyces sp. AA4]